VASGGSAKAIILYEAALGLGISVGPLAGGELGTISWRAPFFGVSVLMAAALLAIFFLLPPVQKPRKKISVSAPIKALRYKGLLTLSGAAFLYNFGFFTLLAYSPFVLDLNERGLGYVFFGWGLFLAITSVFIAPAVQRIFGTVRSLIFLFMLFAADLLAIGIWTEHMALVIGAIIIAGGILGMINTILTTAVMEAAPVEAVCRFIGLQLHPVHRWGHCALDRRCVSRSFYCAYSLFCRMHRRACRHGRFDWRPPLFGRHQSRSLMKTACRQTLAFVVRPARRCSRIPTFAPLRCSAFLDCKGFQSR
jgi:MFS family permease